MRHRRQPGVPLRRGALLHPAGQPGVLRVRRFSRPGAGRGRPPAAAVRRPQVGGPGAAGVPAPLPQARLSLRPAGHGGRAQDLLHHPGAALDRGGGERGRGGGQAAGSLPHLRCLRGHDRPPGGRPPGPANPAGGSTHPGGLGGWEGLLPGRLHRLHPPGAGSALRPAGEGQFRHRGPHLRQAGGGRGGRWDLLSRTPHGAPAPPAGPGAGRSPGN